MSITLSCPFCGSCNVTPSRIVKGKQLYVCADCHAEFPNPVILDAAKQTTTNTTSEITTDVKA